MALVTSLLGVAILGAAIQTQSRVISPEVNPDRTVTFRLTAPNAQKVEVGLEGAGNLAMAKGPKGVWEVTTKQLVPDIYGYSFSVDGVSINDPLNPEIKTNLIWVGNMVTVPGSPKEVWEVQDVPHGEVHRHFYKSGIIGDQRDFLVYTPPGYQAGKSKLPVLYLLHGYSDTAVGWTEVGKAHVILDNLISQGKAKPMIVVMPLGYGVPGFASPGGRGFGDRSLVMENFTRFRQSLLDEVIPMVEKQYRTSNKQNERAIAGLSMGGAETLFIGLNNLDKFAYVGAFSSGGLPGQDPSQFFPGLSADRAKNLKVFFMACGTEDGLVGFQRGFATFCMGKGLTPIAKETPGGHVWMLWRRNLAEFAEKIFK